MLEKRIIRGIVGVIFFCMIPAVAMAQDFRVNSTILSPVGTRTTSTYALSTPMHSCGMAGYGCGNCGHMQNTSNMGCYKGITHMMPSMSQLSTCSTVLGSYMEKSDSQSGSTQNSGSSHGPRRVSEDDHNADPFMPLGDTPWWFMCACACMCAFIIYKRTRKQN